MENCTEISRVLSSLAISDCSIYNMFGFGLEGSLRKEGILPKQTLIGVRRGRKDT